MKKRPLRSAATKATPPRRSANAVKKIRAEIPDQLYRQLERLVKEGWFKNHDDIVNLALRKFANSHRPELLERFIREDVEWGLHGGR